MLNALDAPIPCDATPIGNPLCHQGLILR